MRLAGRYGLRGFPTVILFRDGSEVGRFSGSKTESFVRALVGECLAQTAGEIVDSLVQLKPPGADKMLAPIRLSQLGHVYLLSGRRGVHEAIAADKNPDVR